MQKLVVVLTGVVLMSGAVFSQQASESVENIFNELLSAQINEPVAAAKQPAPAVKPAPAPAVVVTDTAPAPSAAVVETEEPRETVAAEPVVNDQQGIVEAAEPVSENIFTRMYPRARLERDQRRAEKDGMKAVDAAWSTELVFRTYALGEDAGKKLKLANSKDSVDVSPLFPELNFPKGSSAIYEPVMNALYVENTRENLALLEAVLGGMGLAGLSTESDQVEIEAKFVEVSEGTLEELGFEWNFDNAVGVGDDYLFDDGPNGLFADALRGSPSGSSPNLPFARSIDLGYGQVAASGDWSAFGLTDTFKRAPDSLKLRNNGSDPFALLISALDQSTGTDVLSAPRVVTRSGEEATIQVGDLHWFPEVFEGDTSQGTMLNVSYQDFEEKLLGVELIVSPEVDEDRIHLVLNPKITELAGWQNYQMAPANSVYNYYRTGQNNFYTHDPIVGRLPIFKTRSLEAEVTIADGSTIGMGGLINEKIEAYEDRVPFLGSLPLVGRLFRNEGERVVKRNLLMFVTAKKVDPSGRINTTRSFE